MQGGVGADGHVSAAEVVVDGAYHAHDVEVGGGLRLCVGDLACGGNGDKSTDTQKLNWLVNSKSQTSQKIAIDKSRTREIRKEPAVISFIRICVEREQNV